jgi:hypothetical protein
MVIDFIRQPIQELPRPENDVEFLEQRFQGYYYNPNGNWEVITIDWNSRQHRAIFINGNLECDSIEVERNFQITLREVLVLKGVIIQGIQMIDMQGYNIPDVNIILNQSIEDMQPVSATIWSQNSPAGAPIQQIIYQNLPEAPWEAAG